MSFSGPNRCSECVWPRADRINQLQAELEQYRDGAKRAEDWLQRVYQEIEEKLIRPRRAPRP
jgi:hypothetical protein